jgi:hypothetical protein
MDAILSILPMVLVGGFALWAWLGWQRDHPR